MFSSLLSPLHSPSSSCAKIHCCPPQQLVLPLLIHTVHHPLPSPRILPQPVTRLPSLLHTCDLLTNLLNQCYTPQTPAIPNTSTIYHNNRNTPKHTQGLRKPAAPTLLPPLTHPTLDRGVPPYPIPQISIASLTNINSPTPTAYRYYHQGLSYITYKLLDGYQTCELVITKLHT
jgi:hypothetical protein